MRILVADKFEESGLQGLKDAGFELCYEPELKDDSLLNALNETAPTGLIVRSTRVNESHMVDSLKLIVRAGAGYNNIDVDAASKKNIQVCNCPGMNAHAVAELTFGLIIALDRRIPENVFDIRNGKWNKKEYSKAKGLYSRKFGVIGCGNIGRVVMRMGLAFGMEVHSHCKHTSDEEMRHMGCVPSTLIDIAKNCDIVSVHVALAAETKGLINATFIESMKMGAMFINTSRAEVVDQVALEIATKEKGIRAGLDVFEGEPDAPTGEYSGSLKENPNVYCTHHIGASTDQAQDAVAAETVRIFVEFSKTGVAPNCVNT